MSQLLARVLPGTRANQTEICVAIDDDSVEQSGAIRRAHIAVALMQMSCDLSEAVLIGQVGKSPRLFWPTRLPLEV